MMMPPLDTNLDQFCMPRFGWKPRRLENPLTTGYYGQRVGIHKFLDIIADRKEQEFAEISGAAVDVMIWNR